MVTLIETQTKEIRPREGTIVSALPVDEHRPGSQIDLKNPGQVYVGSKRFQT